MWAELSRTGNSFSIDEDNKLLGNTGYILTMPSNDRDELLYLLAYMNSRIVLYQLDKLTTRFDENGWRWLRQFVEELRVPFLNGSELIKIVETANRTNQYTISERVNKLIYHFFDLNDIEVSYIERVLNGY